MQVIYEAYIDAFLTREKLERFYLNLQGVGMSQAFMQIRQFILRFPLTEAQIKTTTTEYLTNTLLYALNYIGMMPQWAVNELTERAKVINADPLFFFNPVP